MLRRVDARSKVIGISGKDRGAILPAGKTGIAYMYMSQSGGFASSTFYMPKHPAWVDAFNAAKPADRYFKAEWTPTLAGGRLCRVAARQPALVRPGPGKLPMTMGAGDEKPGPAFYDSLLRSPFADELSLAFARAAIVGEQLGQDDIPDILSVSLSGHDYVNHAWSAESRLSHDHLLKLDRMFQEFFRYLDTTVGKDNYVAVLTADHGFMPAPEVSQARGLDAGRINASETLARINAELDKRFATPKLVLYNSASALVLDKKLIAAEGPVLRHRRRCRARARPGRAGLRRRLHANRDHQRQPCRRAVLRRRAKAWNAERSGDIQLVLKPNWMFASSTAVTTHGSPHPYDTQVPILIYGPAWTHAGRVDQRVEVVDIAPTLSALLGVAAPAASEGKPLPLGAR